MMIMRMYDGRSFLKHFKTFFKMCMELEKNIKSRMQSKRWRQKKNMLLYF